MTNDSQFLKLFYREQLAQLLQGLANSGTGVLPMLAVKKFIATTIERAEDPDRCNVTRYKDFCDLRAGHRGNHHGSYSQWAPRASQKREPASKRADSKVAGSADVSKALKALRLENETLKAQAAEASANIRDRIAEADEDLEAARKEAKQLRVQVERLKEQCLNLELQQTVHLSKISELEAQAKTPRVWIRKREEPSGTREEPSGTTMAVHGPSSGGINFEQRGVSKPTPADFAADPFKRRLR